MVTFGQEIILAVITAGLLGAGTLFWWAIRVLIRMDRRLERVEIQLGLVGKRGELDEQYRQLT